MEKPTVITKPDPPCTKDCPERSATCHSECERYQIYVEKNEAYKRYMYNSHQKSAGQSWYKTSEGYWRVKK